MITDEKTHDGTNGLIIDPNFTYNKVIQGFSLWEHIVYRYYKIMRKSRLEHFYTTIGTEQITKKVVAQVPDWFTADQKALTGKFAQYLYEFLHSLYQIRPLLEMSFISPNLDQIRIQKNPLDIELVFHTLYQRTPLSQYPFTFQNFSQNITVSDLPRIQQITQKKLNDYLNSISEDILEDINQQYTNWFRISECYQSSPIEFLRRFNVYADIEVPYQNWDWNGVTITAIDHYIEDFYSIIKDLYFEEREWEVLKALNRTWTEEHDQQILLEEEELKEHCVRITKAIAKFQEKEILLKLSCIAYHDPRLTYSVVPFQLIFTDMWKQALQGRLSEINTMLTQHVVDIHMNEVISESHIFKDKDIKEIGIYTKENANKIKRRNIIEFQYVTQIPLIQNFLKDIVYDWLLRFLEEMVSDVRFKSNTERKNVETLIRNIQNMEANLTHFIHQTGKNSTISQKILMFLTSSNLSLAETQMLTVFVQSINKSAEANVNLFKEIYAESYRIADSTIYDFLEPDPKKHIYIQNTVFLKSLFNGTLEKKLFRLRDFCIQAGKVFDVFIFESSED